jgi:hypothetical protein
VKVLRGVVIVASVVAGGVLVDWVDSDPHSLPVRKLRIVSYSILLCSNKVANSFSYKKMVSATIDV